MMREPAFKLLPVPESFSLKGKTILVLGLGDTGLSVARWVEQQGGRVRAADTRPAPPRRAEFKGEFHAGAFQKSLLDGVDLVSVSPGLSLDAPVIQEAMQKN